MANALPKPRLPAGLKPKRRLHPKMVDKQIEPGEVRNPKGGRRRTLYTVIQQMLDKRSPKGNGTRRDDAAEAFIRAMESGSYIHNKEILDREEGRIPNRLANADGSNLKMYSNEMPLDGDEAP